MMGKPSKMSKTSKTSKTRKTSKTSKVCKTISKTFKTFHSRRPRLILGMPSTMSAGVSGVIHTCPGN
jgi:hypothetical protein